MYIGARKAILKLTERVATRSVWLFRAPIRRVGAVPHTLTPVYRPITEKETAGTLIQLCSKFNIAIHFNEHYTCI
jgi:hypothetical protein